MNYLKTIFLLGLFHLIATDSYAQLFDKKEPLDVSYEDCLLKDTSNTNICNCAYETYGKWDKELEKAYNKLLKELKLPKDQNAFIESQKSWKAYRDAEFQSYDNMFNKTGSKWTFERANDRINIVKARTLQLREYYQILTSKH